MGHIWATFQLFSTPDLPPLHIMITCKTAVLTIQFTLYIVLLWHRASFLLCLSQHHTNGHRRQPASRKQGSQVDSQTSANLTTRHGCQLEPPHTQRLHLDRNKQGPPEGLATPNLGKTEDPPTLPMRRLNPPDWAPHRLRLPTTYTHMRGLAY